MPTVRPASLALVCAALVAPLGLGAQMSQPWAGAGIQASSPNPPKARRFTIKVENISKGEALKLSTGKSAPFVSAPVLWVIHTGGANPIFPSGKVDAGQGLETLAETGNPGRRAGSLAGAAGVVAVGAAAKPVGAAAEGPITPGRPATPPACRDCRFRRASRAPAPRPPCRLGRWDWRRRYE